jgi:ribosomal protein S12 methylthiotransferase accessory factor
VTSVAPGFEALAAIADDLVDPRVGVLRFAREQPNEAGLPNFFRYVSEACDTTAFSGLKNFAVGSGASGTRELALAKAMGEAIERYCAAIYDRESLPLTTADDLPDAVDPAAFALYTDEQHAAPGFPFVPFTRATPVRWVEAFDLGSSTVVHVPAAMVYVPYYFQQGSGDSPICQPISTGLACHVGLDRAVLSGLCEVIERDAFTVAWQSGAAPPRIRRDSLPAAAVDLVERMERAHFDVTLFALPTDTGVPVVLSIARCAAPAAPALIVACAGSLDSLDAVRQSVEELAHTGRYMQQIKHSLPALVPEPDHANVVDQLSHLLFWNDHENAGLADFLFASGDSLAFDELPSLATGDPAADVELLVERITALGRRALVADLTTPDVGALGLRVVRALVPGFHPLVMGHRLRARGGTRLPDGPENPIPHPFP